MAEKESEQEKERKIQQTHLAMWHVWTNVPQSVMKKSSLWVWKHETTDGAQTVMHDSLSQVSSVSVWSIKHLTINYCPVGEAADEKEQVISCWAAVLH